MMKAELIENSNTEWIIKVTPKGKSPLNWWVKGIGWADFTDLVKMTVTKNGKALYAGVPGISFVDWMMVVEDGTR